jgi:hypothetical protein
MCLESVSWENLCKGFLHRYFSPWGPDGERGTVGVGAEAGGKFRPELQVGVGAGTLFQGTGRGQGAYPRPRPVATLSGKGNEAATRRKHTLVLGHCHFVGQMICGKGMR